MICFDWLFPESARCLSLDGALVLLHPSNLVLPFCQDAMRTRCLENRVFAVTANRCGEDARGGERLRFTGASQITGPRGEVLARAPADRECVEVVEIDLEEARDKRVTSRNDLFGSRRPAAYGRLVHDGP
jgi:predicted amidohydrolase